MKHQTSYPKFIGLAGLIATLTACASSPISTSINQTNPQQALAKVLQSQMYTSFGYQTNLYLGNQIREQALANATPEELNASDNPLLACEDTHRQAYIHLAKKQLEQGVPLSQIDDDLPEFAQIFAQYQACIQEQYAWLDDDPETEQTAQTLESFEQDWQSESGATAWQSSDDHHQHTQLDQKKSQLFKEYLINSSNFTISGNYQPLLGRLTILPAMDYTRTNIHAHLNQPIFVDLKQGILYLWADNVAMIASQMLDKELGDGWKDKWLAIPLNDGSLPDDFGKNLFKFIADAKKQSHQSLPSQAFSWVSPEQVLNTPYLMENLPADKQAIIRHTPTILQSSPSQADKDYARYLFADTLYQSIVQAYPELIDDYVMPDRQIAEGDSVIDVIHINKTNTNPETKNKLNSKMLVNVMLASLNMISNGYQANLHNTNEMEASPFRPISHYGLQGNQLRWIHHRQYMSGAVLQGRASHVLSQQEPLMIDSFTSITPTTEVFDRLPQQHRVPNAKNSINLLDYGNTLAEKVAAGEDNYLKTLFALIFGQEALDDEMPDDEQP